MRGERRPRLTNASRRPTRDGLERDRAERACSPSLRHISRAILQMNVSRTRQSRRLQLQFSQSLPAQPALHAQSVRPVQSDLPAVPEPVLPEARHNWLEWFAHNAPQRAGERARATPHAADQQRDASRVQEDRGHGLAPFMEGALEHARAQERNSEGWELQHVRARVQELEALLALQSAQAQVECKPAKGTSGRDSRASFESLASSQPAPGQHGHPDLVPVIASVSYPTTPERAASHAGWPPGLPAVPRYDISSPAPPPTPPPDPPDPHGMSSSSDESSTMSETDKKKKKKKKKKKCPTK